MPQIQRQLPPKPNGPAPPKTPGRTAAPAEPSAWDLIDSVRILVYGQSGCGKTTFASTFPDPILWLLCSGGNKPGELRSIDTPKNRARITPRIITSTEQLRGYLTEAISYKTVVLDHASGLEDLTLKEILSLEELPPQKSWGMATQQQYGECTLRCKTVVRQMLNLPGNVVIIAQERTFGGNEDGMSDVIRPTVGAGVMPKMAQWLNPACDYVVQAFKRPRMQKTITKLAGNKEIETVSRGKGVDFCLRTEIHDVYMTKFRVPRGTPLPDVVVDPTYAKVLSIINGGK